MRFDSGQRVHALRSDDYFYRRVRIIGSINKRDLVAARRIGPLAYRVTSELTSIVLPAAYHLPLKLPTVHPLNTFPSGAVKPQSGRSIIGINIGDLFHRTRAAVCVKGNAVAQLVERHRADDTGVQIVMREGNAVGASVDGNGHIVQVGKGITFLRD